MMMNAITENNWVEPTLNLSLYEPYYPPASFIPGEMTVYGTSPLLSPPTYGREVEDRSGDLMSFSNSTLKNFSSSGEMDGGGVAFSNESSNPAVFTGFGFGAEYSEYIFDRPDVRAIFLVLYTIVFCSCFFGNLMVILVVTLHWRMRSITNFFLANLAFADLCVGIFCVYQNIVTYLMESWVFGEFMCKMYHFINSLSTTASVLILVVICIERYLAIIHPMQCKNWLTMTRLRVTIVFVWILSAAISSPRFYYFSTLSMPLPNDQYEILCLPNRLKYDSKLMDMLSMTVLFLIPLAIISILYTHIGIVLWKSSNNKMASATPSESSSSSGCSYREAEHNILQTVNLTLLPVTDQIQNRPTSLNGVPPANVNSAPAQMEKRSASILSSPFFCLNCRTKRRKHHKNNQKRRCGQACRLTNGAGGCTSSAGIPAGNRACIIANGISGLEKCATAEYTLNCKVCQYPFSHQHNAEGIGELGSYEPGDMMTTSFIDCCHQNHHHPHDENEGSCVTLQNNKDGCTRNEATSSPVTATCCGGGKAGKCLRLAKNDSQVKTVTFSENIPPSPFCNKNCSCLEGKDTSKTDPIVVVKFEKKSGGEKGRKDSSWRRRSQCTILLMNNPGKVATESGNNCNGNGRIFGVDPCEDRDSPATISPSTPKFDCEYGHCAPSVGNGMGIANGRGRNHTCLKRNFSFGRNISGDSDMAGVVPPPPPQSSSSSAASQGSCDQNFDSVMRTCTATCPSCGSSCDESYQLFKFPLSHKPYLNQNYDSSTGSDSPRPMPTPIPSAGSRSQSSSVPKRLRRLRIVRSSKYGSNALQTRRKIIRMLIVVVFAFAICHLPFHARKVWQYWSPHWAPYQAGSMFSTLLTPMTFLIMYANSGINPILYAFMSKKFRMSFKDLLLCKMRHSLRISRNASVRSTHAVALSQAGGL